MLLCVGLYLDLQIKCRSLFDQFVLITQMDYDEQAIFGNLGFKEHSSSEASKYPNNCVGVIYKLNEYGEQRMVGTGFLVANDLVATVAHNVCVKKQNKLHSNLIFYPGVSGKITPQNAYKVVQHRFPEEYRTCQAINTKFNDQALLKLEKKIFLPQYLSLGIGYQQQLQEMGIVGYRGPCDQNVTQSKVLLQDKQNYVDNTIIYHKLSTTPGVSGAPILVMRKDKFVAIGIHFGGFSDGKYNGAKAIDSKVLGDLIRWEKQMSSQIRFHVMENSTTQTKTLKTEQWLSLVQKKISVLLATSDQPSFQALKAQLQKLKENSQKVTDAQQRNYKPIQRQSNSSLRRIKSTNLSNSQYKSRRKNIFRSKRNTLAKLSKSFSLCLRPKNNQSLHSL